MYTDKSRKTFVEPECEVIRFAVDDIIATSGEDSWDLGEIETP